jgi:hypothetical protein
MNCFAKIAVTYRESSRPDSLRWLFRKRDADFLTVMRAGCGRKVFKSSRFASYSSSSLRLKSSAFSQLRVLALRGMIGPADPRMPLIHFGLWAMTACVGEITGEHSSVRRSLGSRLRVRYIPTKRATEPQIIFAAHSAYRGRASTLPVSGRLHRACLPMSGAGSQQGPWRLPR